MVCVKQWVERHDTFSTILELYPFLVETWNEICTPTSSSKLYSDSANWNWDTGTRSVANGLRHTFLSFEHIAAFILSKELLTPMKLAESLQGRLNEVYFAFKKVDEITSFYHQLRSNVETEHRRAYAKAKRLAEDVDNEESVLGLFIEDRKDQAL